jgi:hypothetical protein
VKKRAAIDTRVSATDQHLETQLYDLRKMGGADTRSCMNTVVGRCSATPF